MINDMIEKVEFFGNNKITVHVKKFNSQFYNGLILEYSDKHLILLDKIVGKTFIFFKEIESIEPFKERENYGNL